MASAQVKSCVLLAGADGRRRDHRRRARAQPRPHRADAAARRRGASIARDARDGGQHRRAGAGRGPCAGRPQLGGLLRSPPGCWSPDSRLLIGDVGVNWTRTGFLRIVRRMRGIVLGEFEDDPSELVSEEPRQRPRRRPRRARGDGGGGRARCRLAIDELPLVALLGCFAEGETVVRGAGSCASRSPTASPASSRACAGSAPTSRRPRTVSSSRGAGGLRGGTIDARGDHRLAMMGAVAGLASREGVEVRGMEAAAVSYPASSRICRRAVLSSDRRPRRRRQVHRGACLGAAAGLRLPGQRRDVPLRGAALAAMDPDADAAGLAPERRRLARSSLAHERVLLDGARRDRDDPLARGLPGGLASGGRPGGARGAGGQAAELLATATGSPRDVTSARS